MTARRPLFIVGLPRSGTTWIGEVLSSAHKAMYVFEPDNEALSPIAWFCKRQMHRFPYLTPADEAVEYQGMWHTILEGSRWAWFTNVAIGLFLRRIRRSGAELESYVGEKTGFRYMDSRMHRVGEAAGTRAYFVETHPFVASLSKRLLSTRNAPPHRHPLIIKSVHSALSIEWIADHFPLKVLLVLRNPYGLYASYKHMKLPDGFRNLLIQEALQRDALKYMPVPPPILMHNPEDPMAFQIALSYKIMESQLTRHPEWTPVSHDRLCISPHADYECMFEGLDLAWSKSTDEKIDALNRPGKGFNPKRISQQQPFKWKSELTQDEQSAVKYWIDAFELNDFFQQYVNLQ